MPEGFPGSGGGVSAVIFACFAAYLIGSLPTSIITARLLQNIDIREHGSKNAGGTNVLRILGWKAGLFVMLVDVMKGVVATGVVPAFFVSGNAWLPVLTGVMAIMGHVWTVFAGFRGGKGIGTAAGMLIVLYPVAFIFCLLIFLVLAFTTGYVSLASISAAVLLPCILWILRVGFAQPVSDTLLWFAIFMSGFILFTHRENMLRLIKGTENRFGKSKIKQGGFK